MGKAGIDRFHIALVLNHRSLTHSTVTAIYDRYRYDKEKRAALEKWARLLEEIVTASKLDAEMATTNGAARAAEADQRVTGRRGSRGVHMNVKGLPSLTPRVYWLRF